MNVNKLKTDQQKMTNIIGKFVFFQLVAIVAISVIWSMGASYVTNGHHTTWARSCVLLICIVMMEVSSYYAIKSLQEPK